MVKMAELIKSRRGNLHYRHSMPKSWYWNCRKKDECEEWITTTPVSDPDNIVVSYLFLILLIQPFLFINLGNSITNFLALNVGSVYKLGFESDHIHAPNLEAVEVARLLGGIRRNLWRALRLAQCAYFASKTARFPVSKIYFEKKGLGKKFLSKTVLGKADLENCPTTDYSFSWRFFRKQSFFSDSTCNRLLYVKAMISGYYPRRI